MKVHEKAKLYDELIKDYEELLNSIRSHHDEVEQIPNRLEIDKTSPYYYPTITGIYSGSNFGLSIKIGKAEGILKWYKNQK